jgi:hypothetical protein
VPALPGGSRWITRCSSRKATRCTCTAACTATCTSTSECNFELDAALFWSFFFSLLGVGRADDGVKSSPVYPLLLRRTTASPLSCSFVHRLSSLHPITKPRAEEECFLNGTHTSLVSTGRLCLSQRGYLHLSTLVLQRRGVDQGADGGRPPAARALVEQGEAPPGPDRRLWGGEFPGVPASGGARVRRIEMKSRP